MLATAPRPGLVLRGCCPPLTPAEAGAMQTAWLKQVVQELPGAAVVLFGQPADAMPMLRYFAGPGVELREWPKPFDPRGAADPMLDAAAALFAAGHGPVLVRAVDAPEPQQEDLLACLQACRGGEFVWAPDQRGAPWLCGFADAAQLRALLDAGARGQALSGEAQSGEAQTGEAQTGQIAVRRGPWARTVRDELDLPMLWHERRGEGAGAPTLPVRDLQSALQFFETVFGTELLSRDAAQALIAAPSFTLRLQQRGPSFAANGVCLQVDAVQALFASLQPHDLVAAGDRPACATDGRWDFTATDPFGNRLTFRGPA
ncbi:MAG: hypothetical protein H6838_18555 [Planctomycetes bacterium]|nr:hypothetical protein [Planctomycetota bacterium]